MSMIWIIGETSPWLQDLVDVCLGIQSVRRISSLKSFARIMAMGDAPSENLLCFVRLASEDNGMMIHSVFSYFKTQLPKSRLFVVGPVGQEQAKILTAIDIPAFGEPIDQVKLVKWTLTSFPYYPQSRALAERFVVGDIEIDCASSTMKVLATGISESLTPKEVRIIQYLVKYINRPVARHDLIKNVWSETRVSASTVDSHLSRIRKKIDQSFECKLETKYGSGWMLSIEAK